MSVLYVSGQSCFDECFFLLSRSRSRPLCLLPVAVKYSPFLLVAVLLFRTFFAPSRKQRKTKFLENAPNYNGKEGKCHRRNSEKPDVVRIFLLFASTAHARRPRSFPHTALLSFSYFIFFFYSALLSPSPPNSHYIKPNHFALSFTHKQPVIVCVFLISQKFDRQSSQSVRFAAFRLDSCQPCPFLSIRTYILRTLLRTCTRLQRRASLSHSHLVIIAYYLPPFSRRPPFPPRVSSLIAHCLRSPHPHLLVGFVL